MSLKHEDTDHPFLCNHNQCAINIQGDFLVLKQEYRDQENATKKFTNLIPFYEILNVKFVESGSVKRRQSLSVKKKVKLPHIAVKTIKRCKDHRWKLCTVKLKSPDVNLCENWAKILESKLEDYVKTRPKCLLVFVNPYGGKGTAQNIYDKKVASVFQEACIKTEVVLTSFRHHAKTYIETHDLSPYDGIIAVGGDGMLNEVVNGLISLTQSKLGISLNTVNRNPRNCSKFKRPELRVGVIPAGSTDCVSYATQGINDAETSALHIVLGDSHPVDVVSLHNADGIFQQFSMSLTGYGYFGDMLRHSENYRWMGPPRYTFVGANVFLRNKSYSGEVHYLPADRKEDPVKSSFCRTPCITCQDGLTETEAPLFTPLTPNNSFADALTFEVSSESNSKDDSTEGSSQTEQSNSIPDSQDATDANIPCAPDILVTDSKSDNTQPEEEQDCIQENGLLDTCDSDGPCVPNCGSSVPTNVESIDTSDTSDLCKTNCSVRDCDNENALQDVNDTADLCMPDDLAEIQEVKVKENCHSTTGVSVMHEALSTLDNSIHRPKTLSIMQCADNEEEIWEVLKGDFMSVNGVAMSCACERSPLGLSPYCHLCDGAIDLIVVRACSRFDFLRYMLAHTGKGDRFNFSYVEVRRVKAFQFIPSAPQPSLLGIEQSIPSPGSPSSASGGESSIHISLEDLSVQYNRSGSKVKKKRRKNLMKRSQSAVDTNPLSTWNSDGEIVQDANITVRVHRGLILMFCRGVEELNKGEELKLK